MMFKPRISIRDMLLQLLMLSSLCAAPFLPAAAAEPSSGIPSANLHSRSEASAPLSAVEQQARAWAAQLSDQKPFASWKQAKLYVQALGPGTHGWLATLKTVDGRIVGYMVVLADKDGTLRLGEYGVGPSVLYDPAKLDQTLQENGLIGASQQTAYRAVKYYAHPFAALWQVSIASATYWVDAKTSEIIPLKADSWEQILPQMSAPRHTASDSAHGSDEAPAAFDGKIEACRIGETFDAYESLPWLTGKTPLSLQDQEKVQHRLRSSLHLRYVSEPYGDAALYAVPVIGYVSTSDGRLDLAVDMAGTRFIPLETLKQHGLFYD